MTPAHALAPAVVLRSLAMRQTLVLEDARDITIAVDAGDLWLTLEDDVHDVVLGAGDRYRIPRDGRTILTAEAPTRLTFRQEPSPLARRVARWAPRVGRWLQFAGGGMERRWRRVAVPCV